MTIRHLKVFICVVDNNGITRASEKLFIAQPAVSQTISELEKYYGVKLFDRLSRKLYLTPYGEKLLAFARQLCGNFDDIEREIGRSGTDELAYLRIGATVTIGTCLLPDYLSKFNSLNNCQINVDVEKTAKIERMILESKIDIGLVEGRIESKDIVCVPFYKDDIIFVAKDNNVKMENIIAREQGSGSRDAVVANLASLGMQSLKIWTISNTECIKKMLKQGLAIGAMSSLLLTAELAVASLVDLNIGKINRDFVIAYHKDKIITQTMADFIQLVKCDS